MDPTVQVALIGVVATLITTAGVVIAAMINNKKERAKAADKATEDALDDSVILKRMVDLIAENDRKEKTITRLRGEVRELRAEIKALQGAKEES